MSGDTRSQKTNCAVLETDAWDAVPRRLSKWHRSFLDGDILLKWTPYSQERLGAVLLFAQNSKVPVISFERTLVLYCFGARARIGGGSGSN